MPEEDSKQAEEPKEIRPINRIGNLIPHPVDTLPEMRASFIQYYLGEAKGNATRAAILAGYSETHAGQYACRILADPQVRAIIRAQLDRITLTAEEVLSGLAAQARGSLLDVLPVDKRLTSDLSYLTREQARLIKRIKVSPKKEGEEIEIELYDAQAALVQLGKWHGLFTDRLRVDVQADPLEQWDNEALVREIEARGFRRAR